MTTPTVEPDPDTKWHATGVPSILDDLASDPEQGLTADEARARLEKFGANRLPTPGKRGPLKRFLMQLNNMLIYVLIVAGVGKVFLGDWIDASVILGVVLINGTLGFVQEGRAEKAIDSIRNMLSPEALTLRDGKSRQIPAEDLVPGDIVTLRSGDKVPADLRVIEARNLRVEEAPLTGESLPVTKSADPVAEDAQVGDRKSMVFSGTLVVSGRAKAIVVATGSHTQLGHINSMLSGVGTMDTPLLRQIEQFGKVLTVVILLIGALTFAYGMLILGEGFSEMFSAVVGVAVAAIPEGLPAVVTITLALGVQRMARRNAIIRRLPAVETLGSVSRVCSDKTGTLTRNEMVVTAVATADRTLEVTGEGYSPEGRLLADDRDAEPDEVVKTMAIASFLCNEADIHQEDGHWRLTGDPTEGALLPFASKVGVDRKKIADQWPRINAIPFESEHKFMATHHRSTEGESVLFVKGAVDVILGYCDRQAAGDSDSAPLNREFWENKNREIASDGQRVLGIAWLPDAEVGDDFSPATLPDNLILLGMVGIIDPPREEAIAAVKECHDGGIRVTMITGDHALTGASIARMLGIGDGKTYLTGAQLDALDDDALVAKSRDVDVFARTSPEHKLRLVRAMQTCGQVVSMTGDGVNDAPALKQADVGVAMGIKGTEVSKESAEMVLADDNFASITAAIREGRTVYNNIEKAILFMLPTNGGQALTILSAIIFGLTLPVTPPQILWINMVTSITLALAISFEPHELDVMRRPPRRVDRPLLDLFGVWRIAFISVLLLALTFGTFFWLYQSDYPLEFCRTAAVNALIIGQIFYLVNSRYLLDSCLTPRALTGNRWIPIAIVGVILLQLLFTYAPFMQAIFGTAAIPLWLWAWLAAGGVIFFILVELEKFILRTLRSGRTEKTHAS